MLTYTLLYVQTAEMLV